MMYSFIAAIIFVLITPVLYNFFLLGPLPGPYLARFTDLWRLLVVRRGNAHETHVHLHKKYGKIVRIGPRCVSLSGIEAIQSVYAISQKLSKSDFYPVQQGISQGKPYLNLFTTKSNDYHALIKRPIARVYAMTTLLGYEPFVDTTTEFFMNRLDELFAPLNHQQGPACDFGKWLQYYAFDVIGELVFSKRIGFLERDEDVGGILRSLSKTQWLITLGQMPWLDRLFRKNTFLLKANATTSPIVKWTTTRMTERLTKTGTENIDHGHGDMLSRFLTAQAAYPEIVDNTRLMSYAQINVTAGSDTVSITLKAIFYYLLKNPATLKRLLEEIDTATDEGKLSMPCISWMESQKLPYLHAVIKEAFRVHPAVALPLERIVSDQGLDIFGKHLPPGTIVGVNPWVIHRDPDIFGHDANQWRPERWLDTEVERIKMMDSAMFTFGGGARTCIGKNISLLEIYKLVPTLLRKYSFEFVHPDKEWMLHNSFFVHQSGLDLKLRRRII